ncbi:ribosomal-protein-alanine acetyltransferase [Endomicrobiia bacterium]|nr:ribosomal-protein-alanine acetyltransferase [Endomicrobiia bacterium]GHT64350.1 ribosomal-protein-alanine acetyltransferase [Endomicrobiia bacterium]GHT69708.1 ribosomal-protein-alanine acetyltransferase [Endomicrobiia bacterium]GHT75176.1 ribosomal-protein-alanine acetyltransferase [Endomicrobiia bacterium]
MGEENGKRMVITDFDEKFLDTVISIESKSFMHPWTRDMFLGFVKNSTVRFKILIESKTIVGYYVISTVADETELLNIAVDPNFRRKNFGRAMLLDIKKEAISKKTKFIFLEVRRTNIAAKNLYKSFDFTEIGIRKKYYGNEDAITMQLIV